MGIKSGANDQLYESYVSMNIISGAPDFSSLKGHYYALLESNCTHAAMAFRFRPRELRLFLFVVLGSFRIQRNLALLGNFMAVARRLGMRKDHLKDAAERMRRLRVIDYDEAKGEWWALPDYRQWDLHRLIPIDSLDQSVYEWHQLWFPEEPTLPQAVAEVSRDTAAGEEFRGLCTVSGTSPGAPPTREREGNKMEGSDAGSAPVISGDVPAKGVSPNQGASPVVEQFPKTGSPIIVSPEKESSPNRGAGDLGKTGLPKLGNPPPQIGETPISPNWGASVPQIGEHHLPKLGSSQTTNEINASDAVSAPGTPPAFSSMVNELSSNSSQVLKFSSAKGNFEEEKNVRTAVVPRDEHSASFRRKELLERTRKIFALHVTGMGVLESRGGWYTNRIRENLGKYVRVLNAVEQDLKAGKIHTSIGGHFYDLWTRFANH